MDRSKFMNDIANIMLYVSDLEAENKSLRGRLSVFEASPVVKEPSQNLSEYTPEWKAQRYMLLHGENLCKNGQKIQAIKGIRELNLHNWSIHDCKDYVDNYIAERM